MGRRTGQARILLLFALVLIGPLACANGEVGSTGVPTPTAVVFTPATVTIATYSTTVASPEEGDHHLSVTASCRPGEQLLGGGYIASNVFESALFLDAVFPSSLTSWTVRAHSISHYQLETQVYCLQAYPSLDVRLVKASSCSSGTIQVSGGYDSDVRYVLCAARFITPGPTANSIRVGSLKVECMNQATGTNLSESRTFSYTCQWH